MSAPLPLTPAEIHRAVAHLDEMTERVERLEAWMVLHLAPASEALGALPPVDRDTAANAIERAREHSENAAQDAQDAEPDAPPYLIGQTYGYAEIPDGWTPVQANDEHPTGRTLSGRSAGRRAWDRGAAYHAAHDLGIIATCRAEGNRPVRWFPAAHDADEEHPGDWAIRWTPPADEAAPFAPGATPARVALALQLDQFEGGNYDSEAVDEATDIASAALSECQRLEWLVFRLVAAFDRVGDEADGGEGDSGSDFYDNAADIVASIPADHLASIRGTR